MPEARDHHACWPCRHYAQAIVRRPPACPVRIAGFSWIGPACRLYDYEPGADRAEAQETTAHG